MNGDVVGLYIGTLVGEVVAALEIGSKLLGVRKCDGAVVTNVFGIGVTELGVLDTADCETGRLVFGCVGTTDTIGAIEVGAPELIAGATDIGASDIGDVYVGRNAVGVTETRGDWDVGKALDCGNDEGAFSEGLCETGGNVGMILDAGIVALSAGATDAGLSDIGAAVNLSTVGASETSDTIVGRVLVIGGDERLIAEGVSVTGEIVCAIIGVVVIRPIGASNGEGAVVDSVGVKESDCTGDAVGMWVGETDAGEPETGNVVDGATDVGVTDAGFLDTETGDDPFGTVSVFGAGPNTGTTGDKGSRDVGACEIGTFNVGDGKGTNLDGTLEGVVG